MLLGGGGGLLLGFFCVCFLFVCLLLFFAGPPKYNMLHRREEGNRTKIKLFFSVSCVTLADRRGIQMTLNLL